MLQLLTVQLHSRVHMAQGHPWLQFHLVPTTMVLHAEQDELSGADIKAACTEAGLLALRERRMRVTQVSTGLHSLNSGGCHRAPPANLYGYQQFVGSNISTKPRVEECHCPSPEVAEATDEDK